MKRLIDLQRHSALAISGEMRADFVLGCEHSPTSAAGILPGLVEVLEMSQHRASGPESLATVGTRHTLARGRLNVILGGAGLLGGRLRLDTDLFGGRRLELRRAHGLGLDLDHGAHHLPLLGVVLEMSVEPDLQVEAETALRTGELHRDLLLGPGGRALSPGPGGGGQAGHLTGHLPRLPLGLLQRGLGHQGREAHGAVVTPARRLLNLLLLLGDDHHVGLVQADALVPRDVWLSILKSRDESQIVKEALFQINHFPCLDNIDDGLPLLRVHQTAGYEVLQAVLRLVF